MHRLVQTWDRVCVCVCVCVFVRVYMYAFVEVLRVYWPDYRCVS